MAAVTTYETAFILGAKYTGGPAFKRFDRDIKLIDRDLERLEKQTTALPKNMAKVTKATGGAAKGMKAFVGGFVGGFAAMGAAAIGARVAQTFKDIATSAWDAALGVVRARETSEALLKSYGMTSTKAHRLEEDFYAIAKSAEASGHDAELMLDVMSRLKIIMTAADVKKGVDMWEDMVTVMSDASGPTEESAKAAAQAYVQAVKYNRGPLLKKLGYSKIEIQNMKDLSEQERRALINERMRQKFAGATAQWRATDSGRLKVGLTDIGNLMEDLGEAAVANRGKIGDLLSKIAKQASEIAKTELGPWFGKKIQEGLEYLDENLPAIVQNLEDMGKQFKLISTAGPPAAAALNAVHGGAQDLGETMGKWFWGEDNYKKMQEFWKFGMQDPQQVTAFWQSIGAIIKSQWDESILNSQAQWKAFTTWLNENVIQKIIEMFKKMKAAIMPYLNPILPGGTPEQEEAAEQVQRAIDAAESVRGETPESFLSPEAPSAMPGKIGGEGMRKEYAPGIGPISVPKSMEATNAALEPYAWKATAAGPLAEERARLMQEYESNPAVRAKLHRVAKAEWGGQGEKVVQAGIETMFNRAASRGQSLSRLLNPDYYETLRGRSGRQTTTAENLKYAALVGNVARGSNITNLATGNWSGRPGRGLGGRGGYETKVIGGERFSVQAADVGWARKKRASMREMTNDIGKSTGATTNNNVTAPATVNINGVDAGNVPALASSVRTSLRSRDREVLEMLRSARDYEDRGRYV
jgi:hypothetical protein